MANDRLEAKLPNNIWLTDLHCHLLPGIDDGPKDESSALKLLKYEYDSGVRQIALTSHYNCEMTSVDDFLKLRQVSYSKMKQTISRSSYSWADLRLKLGAEVFFSPNLCDIGSEKLCIQDTPFMLLELPVERMPLYFYETIHRLQACGVTPIIAHIERYPYVLQNLPVLCDWIDRGMYLQINAGAIMSGDRRRKLCLKLLKWNLCHVIASDAHSVGRRPPNLDAGLHVVLEQCGRSAADQMVQTADMLFRGKHPELQMMHCPQKILGRWW